MRFREYAECDTCGEEILDHQTVTVVQSESHFELHHTACYESDDNESDDNFTTIACSECGEPVRVTEYTATSPGPVRCGDCL